MEPLITDKTITCQSGLSLRLITRRDSGQIVLTLEAATDKKCRLHWGVLLASNREWQMPPREIWPADTQPFGSSAVQTPFVVQDHQAVITLRLNSPPNFSRIEFVLFYPDEDRWDNQGGRNYEIQLDPSESTGVSPRAGGEVHAVADEIVRAETGRNSWTLMHRFNLGHDLLDRVAKDREGLGWLFVWLRFSAIRQLTWQRNYNTKPRELAHAQDRFTQKLAGLYRREPDLRPVFRLILTTVGRGGEGQRIRDQILEIMHRHHLKEVSGHFLEEWHQKLHNNTTPDDVVICEAYLEFLRSYGHQDRFYQVLEAGGVTRQRLESFERPIRTRPDFVPHLRDGLLHDFSHFLRTLKAAHSGTDLETAINAARHQLDAGLQGLLNYLWDHRHDPPEALVNLVNQITEARRRLAPVLQSAEHARELLYLDLALEQWLRVVVERNLHLSQSSESLTALIARVLENIMRSEADPELAICARHWERLLTVPQAGAAWALQAKSVTDRLARGLSAWIDRLYQWLQPKAEYLGREFKAEPWTINLFSEEVVRGGSLGFVLSLLLRHLDPRLRQEAQMGAWQIVSRGRGAGQVEVVDSLRSIQRVRYEVPTIIIAQQVMGDEEIPEGVTAVIAPDVTDIVSHVAVRARNARILFASCHDHEILRRLQALRGQSVQLKVNPSGDVMVEQMSAPTLAKPSRRPVRPTLVDHGFTTYAVASRNFNEKLVGGKSWHQVRLRGQLPSWIGQPASVALPFGVCEAVLGGGVNQDLYARYLEAIRLAEGGGADSLAAIREMLLEMRAPAELPSALQKAFAEEGLTWPADWERAWTCIKRVWASKWNDRAFLSRRRMGIPEAELHMAVLIQAVTPADYGFVIHTVNPSTGNAKELYGEVVLGLGETLVGNYPGRALSFVFDKTSGRITVLAYPGKSLGLYGAGLIFRSDSNGEDLAGYAGAGLYDSVLLEEPRPELLDYAQEPLVWDEAFRHNLLTRIAHLGLEVERACGSPQDIEGTVARDNYYLVQTRPQVGWENMGQD